MGPSTGSNVPLLFISLFFYFTIQYYIQYLYEFLERTL